MVILFLGVFLVANIATAAEMVLFTTAAEAQNHCPNDDVVWLNTATGIWHTKWQRWYGQTAHGAYVCKKEAAMSGNRASLRG